MRKFNAGNWTQARFNSFIKSGLRSLSQRWPPKYEILNDACTGRKINKRSGKMAKHYLCNQCSVDYPLSEVQVDHIDPIIDPETGFLTWDSVIDKMFCEADGLQVVCKPCHKEKTDKEKQIAKERRNNVK